MTTDTGPRYRQPHLAAPVVERQLRVIEVLRAYAPRPVTGEALASELGVSVRSIERDVTRLTTAGVPIRRRRGTGGGYAMTAPTTVAPVALTPGEVSALVVAIVNVGPYRSATALTALDKLLKALVAHEA